MCICVCVYVCMCNQLQNMSRALLTLVNQLVGLEQCKTDGMDVAVHEYLPQLCMYA